MSNALSQHPAYLPLQRVVKRNQLEKIQALREELNDDPVRGLLADRGLRWAVKAGAVEAFVELLEPEWGSDAARDVGSLQGGLLGEMIDLAEPNSLAEAHFPAFLKAAIAAGAPLESTDYVTVPLTKAIASQREPLVKALLEAGADPNGLYRWSKNGMASFGFPPLLQSQSLSQVALFLEHGASRSARRASMHEGVFGGVADLLFKWPEAELNELWATLRSHGVTLDTLVESKNDELVPLGEALFARPMDPKYGPQMGVSAMRSSFLRTYEKTQARRWKLQELMVNHGLDLMAIGPHGRSWASYVQEDGSPLLCRQLDLNRRLPSPAPRRKGPRF